MRHSLLAHITARSGTAPYNLIARVPRWRGCRGWLFVYFAARSGTAPYNPSLVSPAGGGNGVVARLLCGALGDHALQHRPTSLMSPAGGGRGWLLVYFAARSGTAPYSLVAYLLKNGKPTSSRGRVSIYEGAMIRKAGK